MTRYKLHIRLLASMTIIHEISLDFDPVRPCTYEALIPSWLSQPQEYGRVQVELKAVSDEPL